MHGPHAEPVDVPSLAGFTIGVTADRRAEEQIELLTRRGARVVHGPCIRTLPLSHDDVLRDVTQLLIETPPDIVVANTGIGMRAWLSAADVWGVGEALVGALGESRIFARGPKAASAVHQAGLRVTVRAQSERLDEVVQLMLAEGVTGKRVGFQRHGDESPATVKALIDAGADVVEIPVYEWTLPADDRAAVRLIDAVVGGGVHAVTFTSAPAVRNLVLIAEEHDLLEPLRTALQGSVAVACVGPVCAAAAVELGVSSPAVPSKFRLGPMVRELARVLDAQVRCFRCGEHELVVRGSVVDVDGERVTLADREAGLLHVLISRPGVPRTKTELLHEVWGDRLTDAHVVEVTIARLRRRLGPCSDAIVAMPRRGYRFDGQQARPTAADDAAMSRPG